MDSERSVKSTKTMFEIIELLCDKHITGVTELAEELGLAKSTIHSHLNTMREYGYVVKRDGKYQAGLRFFVTGNRIRSHYPLYEASRTELKTLSRETGEITCCVKYENGDTISIDGYAQDSSLNADIATGTVKPIHSTASGKAIMAKLSREEVDSIINTYGLNPLTEQTITNSSELYRSLDQIRDRGYALNIGEERKSYNSIGVAITAANGEVVGAITIGGAASRITREYCEDTLASQIMETADDIEINLSDPQRLGLH
ncbi:IclR family transcriptional regulator [Halobellus rubicundus]|uniref:IclR family transcriptional regulator n=1 Tax=Halobellus rubicundus TaxID=2996466 RepID=A0ABD5MJ52_9EURY